MLVDTKSSKALRRDSVGSVSVRLRRKQQQRPEEGSRHSGEFHHLMMQRASQLPRHSEENTLERNGDFSFVSFDNGVASVHEVRTNEAVGASPKGSPKSSKLFSSQMAPECRASRRSSGLRRGSELLNQLRSNLGSARVSSCNDEFEFVANKDAFRRSNTQISLRKKDSYKKAMHSSQERIDKPQIKPKQQQRQQQSKQQQRQPRQPQQDRQHQERQLKEQKQDKDAQQQRNGVHDSPFVHQRDAVHQNGRRAARMASTKTSESPLSSSTAVLKGLLWQQRDKLFSKWKQRFFILNETELQCRRRDKGLADVVLFSALLVDIEDMELLDRRGYLTICITTAKDGKIFLRKTEGIREWFTQINTNRQVALTTRGAFTRAAPSTSSWREPLRRAVMTRRQLTDSAGIKDYVMARRMRGLKVSQSNSDSTPDLSHLTSTELFDLYKEDEFDVAARMKDVQHRRSLGGNNINNLGLNEELKTNKSNIKRLSLMTDIDLPSLRQQALQGRTAPLAVEDELVSPSTTMTTTKSSSSSNNSLRSRSSSKSTENKLKQPPPLNTGL